MQLPVTTFVDASALDAKLDTLLAGQARLEEKMSALSDAIAGDQAAVAALDAKIELMEAAVKAFPAQLQAAVDQAVAAGATPEQLAALAQLQADATAKAAEIDATLTPPALPAPAPAG